MKRLITCAVMVLLLSVLPVTALAYEVGCGVATSPEDPRVGSEVTMIVSLDGYTQNVEAIRGLQVDIDGVDPGVLKVVSYETMIDDSALPAMSNTASYNAAAQRVRLLYAQMNETLPAPCEGVLKVVFQINPDLTESGSITLPVTLKMQTLTQRITLNSEYTIHYTGTSSPAEDVEITWGALEYTYSDGVWNARDHIYEGAGWSDGGSGFVTVSNAGETGITADFTYTADRSEISGSFTDGVSAVSEPVPIGAGQEKRVSLVLAGKPAENLSSTKIGSVTVTIGGE